MGERKLVTVLFADVTGSTELADRLDAEELREVLSRWFAAMRAEIEAQGGTVEKYIGDAVMAVFGVPTAHEDDPSRALRAALALRERLAELNGELAASHGINLEIRVGVNTGEAVTTPEPAPGEAMVTGLAVNAAARLEQLAEPGQTVVAERTARAAPGFRFDELGPFELRGQEAPVRARVLVAAPPGPVARGLPGMHAPLIGRERELDLLLALQERVVAERRPHLVTIYGEPGVGKSRLVRELLRRVDSGPEPPRVVVGRCLSYGDGVAYWPLAEILKGLVGISDDDPAALALGRIERFTADLLLEPGRVVATLAFTLGLDARDAEFARLQPSSIRAELHRVWRAVLSALAERRPLVVVVDDIHWADAVLLELLEELAERTLGPILFVCPSRPELTAGRPTWGGGRRNFSSVFLNPLPPAAAGELIEHLLAVDGLPDRARGSILERAEGNPFFLEEILRQLIDGGRVVRNGDRWQTDGDLTQLELPDTVQAVLAARIDLLTQSEKRTLQQASVVGRIFWRGAVAALVGDAAEVDGDLRRLEERELVAPRLSSSLLGEEELAFSHILTRDVAYESLPRRDRPRAHARVASWIEHTAGDRRREYVGLLAHHYGEAYRGARRDRSYPPDELEALRRHAFELLLEASQDSLRATAYRAARSLAESALEVAAAAEERATALEALGDGYRHAALGDGAWESYTRATDVLLEAGSSDGERVAGLCGRALETLVRWTGTMTATWPESTADRYLEAGLRVLPDGESEARVRLLTVQAFWGQAYPGSSSPLQEPALGEKTGTAAAEMAERLGRPDLAVVALDGVSHNLQRQLRYDAAYEVALRRLELARTAGDLTELGDSYAVAAWHSDYVGAFAEARELGREGYELLRSDVPLYAAHSLIWGALASFYLGDWDELLRDVERAVEALGERAETLTTGFLAPWPAAAFALEARGERAASEHMLAPAYAAERRRGRFSPELSPLIVRTLVLRGEAGPARERVAAFSGAEGRENAPLMLVAEADLAVSEERWNDLPQLAEALRATRATSGAHSLAPIADRLEGLAALAAGDPEAAVASLAAAVGGFDELAMAVDAALARLDEADALLASHRVEEALRLAADARGPLERAGFQAPLAQAVSLLESAHDRR